jgi:type I restriction enzyme, S subunit
MDNWVDAKLGDVLELKRGYDLAQQNRVPGSVPIVSSSGPTGWHSTAMAKAPGVVTGRYGTLGQVFFVETDYWPLNTTLYVKNFKGNDPRFVSYFLRALDFFAYSDKAAVPGLNRNDLHLAPVRLTTSVDEQRAIAALLGSLDDKIEFNRRMNETLEGMAQAIFRDWFVDFGPTRRKLSGVSDPVAIMGGLVQDSTRAAELAALFPAAIADNGLPEGWVEKPLGQHMLNFDSKRVPVSSGERAKRKGPYPYHGATSVMDHVDDFLFDGIYLLVGEDGSVVRESGIAFTQYVWGKIWVNNHAHVLQGKGAVSTEQLLAYFQHEPVAPFITGAVQLKLSQGRMNSMPFIFPGDALCVQYQAIVAPLYTRLRSSIEENQTLATTRDLLLPKLMSGEIRLRDAEAVLEAVT